MSCVAAIKSKVFLFGATGNLGSNLLHFFTSPKFHAAQHFELTVLVRADTLNSKDEKKLAILQKLKECGERVHVVTGDAQACEDWEIAKWISGHDIVISALAIRSPGPSIEWKLLEAVKLAKVPWFIPGMFGCDVTKAVVQQIPAIAEKKKVMEAVRTSGVNYFIVFSYAFTEYLINPWVGADIPNGIVTAARDFQDKLSTMTAPDIAQLTVEALIQRNEPHVKNQDVHLVGDTVSYQQIAEILEEHWKKPFKRVSFTKEETAATVAADTACQNIPARVRLMFAEQKGVWIDKKDSWNVKHASDIHVTTFKEYISQQTL